MWAGCSEADPEEDLRALSRMLLVTMKVIFFNHRILSMESLDYCQLRTMKKKKKRISGGEFHIRKDTWQNQGYIIEEHGEGDGTPLQYSCLESPMVGEAWQAVVHGVAKSRARLSDFTFTFHFHALEKEMATHSSVLAWRIPGTAEPSGLPSMGSHRVEHD